MGQKDEPSMEEILSSIKRIIAEEGDAPAFRRQKPVPQDDPDILELTQTFGEPEPTVLSGAEVDPILGEEDQYDDGAFVDPDAEPAFVREDIVTEQAEPIEAKPPAPVAPIGAEALISVATADASREALAALSRMVVKPEDPAAENTLEGLVREMLRPMLTEWLDANLPGIVQATIDREVARIAGRSA